MRFRRKRSLAYPSRSYRPIALSDGHLSQLPSNFEPRVASSGFLPRVMVMVASTYLRFGVASIFYHETSTCLVKVRAQCRKEGLNKSRSEFDREHETK